MSFNAAGSFNVIKDDDVTLPDKIYLPQHQVNHPENPS